MMIHTHVLLFDTNVFKKIIARGNEAIFDRIFRQLNDELNPLNQYTGFYSTVSPFQFLEFLGRLPPNIEIDEFTAEEIATHGAEISKAVFDKAKLKYQNHGDLSESSLKERNEKNKAWLSEKAVPLYRDIVDNLLLRNDFTAELKANLAMDFTYRYPYSKILEGDSLHRIHANSMLDIYRAHKEKVNYTQMRGVLKFCEDLERTYGRSNMGQGLRELLDGTRGVKEFRDLVDLDLVQFACLGAFAGQGDKLPALILTGDTRESVLKRIRLFKSAFAVFDKKLKEEDYFCKNSSISELNMLDGKIAFVNMDTWTITEFFDVSSVNALVDSET